MIELIFEGANNFPINVGDDEVLRLDFGAEQYELISRATIVCTGLDICESLVGDDETKTFFYEFSNSETKKYIPKSYYADIEIEIGNQRVQSYSGIMIEVRERKNPTTCEV